MMDIQSKSTFYRTSVHLEPTLWYEFEAMKQANKRAEDE